MSEVWTRGDDARRASAAEWLVRLQAPDLDEAEAMAFDAWLNAHPANAAAYDTALAVMLEVEAASDRIAGALKAAPAPRPVVARRGWLIAGGLAAAATIALAVTPFGAFETATRTFTTAKGEHRSV
jgi:transmembrane sensor